MKGLKFGLHSDSWKPHIAVTAKMSHVKANNIQEKARWMPKLGKVGLLKGRLCLHVAFCNAMFEMTLIQQELTVKTLT